MMDLLASTDDSDATPVLLGWIGKLRLNMNYQYEFIELIMEISFREGLSIPQLLAEEPYSETIESQAEKIPQKAKSVLRALKLRRFPRLLKAEELFSKTLSKIPLPEGVKVDHSPYFENPEYRLTIAYKTGEGLRKKIRHLSRLKNIEEMVVSWDDLSS
jgi:hypothetical protein